MQILEPQFGVFFFVVCRLLEDVGYLYEAVLLRLRSVIRVFRPRLTLPRKSGPEIHFRLGPLEFLHIFNLPVDLFAFRFAEFGIAAVRAQSAHDDGHIFDVPSFGRDRLGQAHVGKFHVADTPAPAAADVPVVVGAVVVAVHPARNVYVPERALLGLVLQYSVNGGLAYTRMLYMDGVVHHFCARVVAQPPHYVHDLSFLYGISFHNDNYYQLKYNYK